MFGEDHGIKFFLGSLLLAVVCINVSDANLHHLFPPFPFIVCSIGFSRQDMNICSGAPRRFNLPKNYYYCRLGEVFSLYVLNITEFHFREIRPDFSIKNECNWGNIKNSMNILYLLMFHSNTIWDSVTKCIFRHRRK